MPLHCKVKKITALLLALLFTAGSGAAQEFSGTAETAFRFSAGTAGAAAPAWGAEEYANLRFQTPVGGNAAFFGALNLTASAGSYAADARAAAAFNPAGLLSTPVIYGENYAAAVEAERLYLRISGENIQWDSGLMRIPFGFSQVWRPVDFLNPANPLKPDARLRGALGTVLALFPGDAKAQVFAAAPKDPLGQNGGRFGAAFENHWSAASLQALYVYESPADYAFPAALEAALPAALGGRTQRFAETNAPAGLHRAGLSVKADLEISLGAEFLYTLNPGRLPEDVPESLEGLSFSAGAEYPFFDGKLLTQAAYLFSGENSETALSAANLAGYQNRHYLYASASWLWSNWTTLTLGGVYSFEDYSGTVMLVWKSEVFQGITLQCTIQVPLDRESFGAGSGGELGPGGGGTRFLGTAGVKVKF